MTEILTIIGLALKLAVIIFDKNKATPSEKRREELSKLDSAIELAKEKKDLTEVSKWLSTKL